MKKTILSFSKLFTFLILLVVFFSCSEMKYYSTKSSDILSSRVIQKPVVADLDVAEKKVTGTASNSSSISLKKIENNAIYDALSKSNADILIEPRFTTEIKKGVTTITVTGYPAIYKNFRPLTEKDTILLKYSTTTKVLIY